jgi:hypothetical protein
VAPSIAGRWRALTKSNLDKLHDQLNPKSLPVVLGKIVITHLSAVLTISGYRDLPQELTDDLNRNLFSIIQCLLELRCAIREKTLFYDLEVILHPFGTPFNPTLMEDSFGCSRQPTGDGQILCTTDLGLRRCEVKLINDNEWETDFLEDILLKPKVALQSVLDDFSL